MTMRAAGTVRQIREGRGDDDRSPVRPGARARIAGKVDPYR